MSDISLMRRASEAMTGDCHIHSTDRFIIEAIHWLTETLGDLHLQFVSGTGWTVISCSDAGLDEVIEHEQLSKVLALAVLDVAAKQEMET